MKTDHRLNYFLNNFPKILIASRFSSSGKKSQEVEVGGVEPKLIIVLHEIILTFHYLARLRKIWPRAGVEENQGHDHEKIPLD